MNIKNNVIKHKNKPLSSFHRQQPSFTVLMSATSVLLLSELHSDIVRVYWKTTACPSFCSKTKVETVKNKIPVNGGHTPESHSDEELNNRPLVCINF